MAIKTRIAAAVLCATCPAALAANIPVASANVSSSSQIAGFNRIDDYIVNGNGLGIDGSHTTVPDLNMWLSSGGAFGGEDTDPFVLFDLGDEYIIDSIRVWNYNERSGFNGADGFVPYTRRGVNEVAIEYGTTPALGATVPGITNFAEATGLSTYTGETFDGFTPFIARYIRFDIASNHGGDNNFYGLSEVRFDGRPVPTPASLPILTLGLGLIAARRRRG